jgi:hypothetical protein
LLTGCEGTAPLAQQRWRIWQPDTSMSITVSRDTIICCQDERYDSMTLLQTWEWLVKRIKQSKNDFGNTSDRTLLMNYFHRGFVEFKSRFVFT